MPASSGIQRSGAVITRSRQTAPVQVRGVALVRQLLRDGSALYAADAEGAPDGSVRHARAALLLD
jgi:hypothetical protein